MNIPFPEIPLVDRVVLITHEYPPRIKLDQLYLTPANMNYIFKSSVYIEPAYLLANYHHIANLFEYLEAKYNRVADREVLEQYIRLPEIPILDNEELENNATVESILGYIDNAVLSGEFIGAKREDNPTDEYNRMDGVFYYGRCNNKIYFTKNKWFYGFTPIKTPGPRRVSFLYCFNSPSYNWIEQSRLFRRGYTVSDVLDTKANSSLHIETYRVIASIISVYEQRVRREFNITQRNYWRSKLYAFFEKFPSAKEYAYDRKWRTLELPNYSSYNSIGIL